MAVHFGTSAVVIHSHVVVTTTWLMAMLDSARRKGPKFTAVVGLNVYCVVLPVVPRRIEAIARVEVPATVPNPILEACRGQSAAVAVPPYP